MITKQVTPAFFLLMIQRFTKQSFHDVCDSLALIDISFGEIIDNYGYPPFWIRPNRFETLLLTILEQQVSLASAYAAYKKLKEKTGKISPEIILALSDEELRACYFSRQKIVYVKGLATALQNKNINLRSLYYQPENTVRAELKKLKGIGDWTVDIYLIHALRRSDVFPIGDLALVNAVKMLKAMPAATKEDILQMAEAWRPHRTVATMLLWHYYIKKKNIRLLH